MNKEIDILENEIVLRYPDVLEMLLRDQTTKKNIIWATVDYEELGDSYSYDSYLKSELITGKNGNIIMPRVHKNKTLQQFRAKEMAEVFTPPWVCNAQINLIDEAWFGRKGVFNCEIKIEDGINSWKTNENKITFPKGKTWQQYIADTRLEITCGEGPYITSRYDSNTGEFIPLENRIGIFDRKLRVINENCHTNDEWLKAAEKAIKSIYGFEWQGDSLLLAREAILISFIENYIQKFNEEPPLKSIHQTAYIISWNIWQMDGLKGVIPNSCSVKKEISVNLFGDQDTHEKVCEGCEMNEILKHNGIYSFIKDWSINKQNIEKEIRFVDLIK